MNDLLGFLLAALGVAMPFLVVALIARKAFSRVLNGLLALMGALLALTAIAVSMYISATGAGWALILGLVVLVGSLVRSIMRAARGPVGAPLSEDEARRRLDATFDPGDTDPS